MKKMISVVLMCVMLICTTFQSAFALQEANAPPHWDENYRYDSVINVGETPEQDTRTWRLIYEKYYKTYTTSDMGRPEEIEYFLDAVDEMAQIQHSIAKLLITGKGGMEGNSNEFQWRILDRLIYAAPGVNKCETIKNNLIMWWDGYLPSSEIRLEREET